MVSVLKFVSTLSRGVRKQLLFSIDAVLLAGAVWTSFALRFNTWWPEGFAAYWPLVLTIVVVSLGCLWRMKLYSAVVRHAGPTLFVRIAGGLLLAVLMLVPIAYLTPLAEPPRSVWIIYWFVAIGYAGGYRLLFREVFQAMQRTPGSKPVLIYGAGSAGQQLARALSSDEVHRPVAFIDDDRTLHGCYVHNLKVYPADSISSLVAQQEVDAVLFAIPSLSRGRRAEILKKLEPVEVEVLVIPGLSELASGQRTVSNVRLVAIEDVLGRDTVAPRRTLLKASVEHRSVLVTGAGGSIGSELSRQILHLGPTRLVLFEWSELALYKIERELRGLGLEIPMVPVLGNVLDQHHVEEVIRSYGVQTIFHAAAYKHVPLVEFNPINGVRNNVFGTLRTARAAVNADVDRFVLVSTDKAVRPTNVMGASKRVAELVLQGLADDGADTCFSMVRFGNVLGSSGSVVPLFREQIQNGGPVTVTHPDVTRYFMTIPEAVSLVLQSSSMASGGDVFLLDMGEPVKILDLARQLIRLSGYTVRDGKNPEGEIGIEFIGLRPGEKLYEELLLGEAEEATEHPRIRKAFEEVVPWSVLRADLHRLETALDERDVPTVLRLMQHHVDGYTAQPVASRARVA